MIIRAWGRAALSLGQQGAARIRQPKKIRVLYPSGAFAYLATLAEARHLIRAEVGERKGSRQRIYAVKLYAGPCVPKSGTKYSHNHAINETAERAGLNVQNVWTFRDIADEDWPIYNRATIECGAGVRESRLNKFNPGIL